MKHICGIIGALLFVGGVIVTFLEPSGASIGAVAAGVIVLALGHIIDTNEKRARRQAHAACANCGRVIGKLEKAYVWHGQRVCLACRNLLGEQEGE